MRVEYAGVASIRPNTYNNNKMGDRKYQLLVKSIAAAFMRRVATRACAGVMSVICTGTSCMPSSCAARHACSPSTISRVARFTRIGRMNPSSARIRRPRRR